MDANNQLMKTLLDLNLPFQLKTIEVPDGALKGRILVEIEPRELPCHLLGIPVELRCRIYEYVLVRPEPIALYTYTVKKGHVKVVSSEDFVDRSMHRFQEFFKATGKWVNCPPSELSILQTNKQIHSEATPIAYSNCFRGQSSTAIPHFIRTVGSSLKHVTTIDLGERCTRKNLRDIFQSLKTATGLKTLYLDDKMLYELRYMAGSSDVVGDWAALLVKEIIPLLLALQEAYEADRRTWKVVDLVQVKKSKKGGLDARPAASSKQVKEFVRGYRKLVGERLELGA